MVGDFTDPKHQLEEELDDVNQEIDEQEKKKKVLEGELAQKEQELELLGGELDDLYKKEKNVKAEIERLRAQAY